MIFTTPFDGFGNACFLRRHFISSNWIKNEYVFCFPLCMTTLVTRLIYIFYPSYLHDNKKPDLDDSDCLQWINVSYLFILDFRSVVINAFCLNNLKLTYSIIFKYVCPWNIYFVDKCQTISRETNKSALCFHLYSNSYTVSWYIISAWFYSFCDTN